MTLAANPVIPLKRLAAVMPSNVDKHSVDGEQQVSLCNYVDVYKNERITDALNFMEATATEAQVSRFTLQAHDVIVTKDSEEPTDIGIPAYVPSSLPGVVCGYHLAVLRPSDERLYGGYLHWALQSAEVKAYYSTAATGIFAADLLAFVQDTQPTEWAKFKKWHNGQSEAMFVKRVAKQLDTHGTLHVLRHGFKDVDAKFSLCAFKPAHGKNPKLVELYAKNRLTVIRQLHYSLHNENSIDLVFFVNGLPVATCELKTDLTQSVKDAITQYKKDRLPKDPKTKEPEALLQFKTRALVHFAVSSDQAFMTTKLAGDETSFLPSTSASPTA